MLNKNFIFKNYFNIPDENINYKSNEKYFINEKDEEELLEINISKNIYILDNNKSKISPIYIKKNEKLFLIGLINEEKQFYIFNKKELKNIRKKIENIEMKYKLYQIKKLDFNKLDINDDEMNFIFQYDYINLKYLDIQNKKLTNQGLKALQNKSLKNLEYLNLSNNNITDVGLTYLNYLSNLKELVMFNMKHLSDDYFLSLEENSFINKIDIFRCDKKKLSLKFIHSNYSNFILPNLTCLNFLDSSETINLSLKQLFQLNNLYTNIKELDLSNTGITDNEIIEITEYISAFKNIELINLENTKLTIKSKKYLEQIHKQNIKIKLSPAYIKYYLENKIYNIFLGGSTISGKTTYLNSYINKNFYEHTESTIGTCYHSIKYIKNENIMIFHVWDTCRWNSSRDNLVLKFLSMFDVDSVILLFDITQKEDFEGLPHCLNMITNCYKLEELPVLLIGNKADLKKNVDNDEIEKFWKSNNLIGYFEVSSVIFLNVNESFNFMFDYIIEKDIKFLNEINNIIKK